MARSSGSSRAHAELAQLLRFGGAKIPAGFAAKSLAATKTLLKKNLETPNGLRAQASKLYGRLGGASPIDVHDPANQPALDALLAQHKKIAAKKLAFPKVRPGLGSIFPLPGTISGTVVPPFDFADFIPSLGANVHNPTMSASASVNGQISGSVVSASAIGFNTGNEYARVGIYFHPIADGTLTISATPTFSFQWSTNSLNTSFVGSSGGVALTIYALNDEFQIGATAGTPYVSWENFDCGQIHFGFGFDVQQSASASLQVSPGWVYLCFVEVDASATGVGWPGSLATAMASATVPAISYEFVPRLLTL